MDWFKRKVQPQTPSPSEVRNVKTEGQFAKCPACEQLLLVREYETGLLVCPICGHHGRLSAAERLAMIFDDGEWEAAGGHLAPTDPLGFSDRKGYVQRLAEARLEASIEDAIIIGVGKIGGIRSVVGSMELAFVGGSLGSVVGESIVRGTEIAVRDRSPLVLVSASGGARMQEGALSLMQMAKISSELARLDRMGIPFISVLTDPTTGGVTASYAMLGDINIAEPGALIGFAGPRVIEQTIRQKLPAGFQRSEFLLAHGMLDYVVSRSELKDLLISLIGFMVKGEE